VKIDVEGAELLVLEGMTRILSDTPRPVLWVEWMPKCMQAAGYGPSDMPDRLRALGFDELTVFDDVRGETFSTDEIVATLGRNELPTYWHSNVLARRSAG
jgi:hypothetical protein